MKGGRGGMQCGPFANIFRGAVAAAVVVRARLGKNKSHEYHIWRGYWGVFAFIYMRWMGEFRAAFSLYVTYNGVLKILHILSVYMCEKHQRDPSTNGLSNCDNLVDYVQPS
jgi:hypothetical protein